ncbi:MAG: hypothetical protein IJN50_00100 [Clostridia bacterium]|nr:hypothetical protein [Clostridia bacterium]
MSKTILNLEEQELPYLLKFYKEKYGLVSTDEDITKRYNTSNNLTKEFDKILRKCIGVDKDVE